MRSLTSSGLRIFRFAEFVAAVRLGHLRLAANLTAPGGTAVLITYVVSSAACPELQAATDRDLPGVLAQALCARNFFHGTSPARGSSRLRCGVEIAFPSARMGSPL